MTIVHDGVLLDVTAKVANTAIIGAPYRPLLNGRRYRSTGKTQIEAGTLHPDDRKYAIKLCQWILDTTKPRHRIKRGFRCDCITWEGIHHRRMAFGRFAHLRRCHHYFSLCLRRRAVEPFSLAASIKLYHYLAQLLVLISRKVW